MNRVRVEIPEVDGDTLTGGVSSTGPVSRFFSGKPFRATYSASIEDLPEPLRPIPVLAHVCPVAWATGADVVVDTADATFLDGLRRIRATMLDLYPEFMTGGSIHCPNPVEGAAEPATNDGAGMLFTGGVDSTATYVRHREEDPTLVSVRGWVIGLDEDERWDATRDYVTSFADARGHDTDFVETNMLDFLAMPLLQAHFQRYLDGAWYSSVGHGLGLLGLCAPLAHARGWGSLYIAATHTEEWERPWGSRPDIDDHVAWRGTECVHDGYELSRQDKIERIAEYVESESPNLPLRTCVHHEAAGNCSSCEKCYRTIVGMLLAGLDPNDHGYEFDPNTFPAIREYFETGDSYLNETKKYHWGMLQEEADPGAFDEYAGGEDFGEWLRDQDFAAYVDASERPLRHRLLQQAARNTPTPVYSTLYPLYRRVSKTAQ